MKSRLSSVIELSSLVVPALAGHQHGPKEGKELTDYEAGIRSGYLQAQSDHAGIYKYKKALSEGKSKQEARDISQRRGRN